jgi:uridine kinase
MGKPFLLGVAGGSGSGKTTVAERLAALIGGGTDLALLRLDAYYRDRNHLPFDEREAINYDHPDAFDWPLLLDHVQALQDGLAVDVPVYDFATYVRRPERDRLEPARIVVVEGILVLYEPELRERFDLRVFVDTDADVRFIRRLERDVAERERSTESVIEQYLATVRPSHLQFIEPSKRYADVIIPHGGMNAPALDVLMARVRELLSDA